MRGLLRPGDRGFHIAQGSVEASPRTGESEVKRQQGWVTPQGGPFGGRSDPNRASQAKTSREQTRAQALALGQDALWTVL